MPQCDHASCHHNVAVIGQCGSRRCPRNAALCNHSVALDRDLVPRLGTELHVVGADPFHLDGGLLDDDRGPIVGNGFSLTDQVPPELVLGRDDERALVDEAVLAAATNQEGAPRVILFSGPTASGKTALLRRLDADLRDPDRACPVDLTEVRTVNGEDLRDRIKHRIARNHGGWWSRFNHGNSDPEWSIETPKDIGGVPLPFKAKVNANIANGIDKLTARDLPSLISHCSERSTKRGKTLVVSLDSGSELDPRLLADLASGADLAQSNGAPCVIVVTTTRNAQQQVAAVGRSRYEQLIRVSQLDDLDREDIRSVLKTGANRVNASWDSQALDEAARWSSQHVRLSHLMGHHATEIVRRRGGNRITPADVDLAKRSAFDSMTPTYRAALRRTGVETSQRPIPAHITENEDAQVLIALDATQQQHGRRPVTASDVARTSSIRPDITIERLNNLFAEGLIDTDGTHFRSRVPYISTYWERTLDLGVNY